MQVQKASSKLQVYVLLCVSEHAYITCINHNWPIDNLFKIIAFVYFCRISVISRHIVIDPILWTYW